MRHSKSLLTLFITALAVITTSCSPSKDSSSFSSEHQEESSSEPIESSESSSSIEEESSIEDNGYIPPMNEQAFRLSSLREIADDDGIMSYKVYSPYTDTFEIKGTYIKEVAIYHNEQLLGKEVEELRIDLEKDEIYVLKVTATPNDDFKINVKAIENVITYPYDLLDPEEVVHSNSSKDPLIAANIEYNKRMGGTYIYSNNPEMIPTKSVNTAFIKDEGLSGDIFMTFEHANWTSSQMYLGYELKNEGDEDVYITVTNIGYQAGGTWFGQLAWYDYYNTQFDLPEDYFSGPGLISSKYSGLDYAYQNYKPRIYQPTTYRLPAKEKFFVIGGTTKNTYNKIDVGDTANQRLAANKCANGNVRFLVTNGSVTGTFYAYTGPDKLESITEAVGYKVGGYSAQYCGIANHKGVIDTNVSWEFNDSTPNKTLPVSYTNYYDNNVPKSTTPYKEYNNTEHEQLNKTRWMTHLNPQNDHQAVGSDMVDFSCTDEHGNKVVIDSYHADGNGNTANTANWMIEYQEQFTFINSGNKDRTIKINYKDHGTLTMIVRDTKTGALLETYYTCGQAGDNPSYTYQLTVPSNSDIQVTMCYSLVACSYGSVLHWVTLS